MEKYYCKHCYTLHINPYRCPICGERENQKIHIYVQNNNPQQIKKSS